MTKKVVDIIPKIRLNKTNTSDIVNIPELIYKNLIVKYSDTVRTDEQLSKEWSSVFLEELAQQYEKKSSDFKLLSLIEFNLDNRVYKAKKTLINNDKENLVNKNLSYLAKNTKYTFPIEAKHSEKLLNILLEYLFRTEFDDHEPKDVDSYTKSLLKNFIYEFKRRDLVANTKMDDFAFEAYPSILFAHSSDYTIAIAMKPNNIHFIDTKVQDIDKVFSISLGVYKNSKNRQLLEYETLSNYFNSFSMFLYKETLDRNIKDSIGEAADIARYWYTEGLKKLNNMQDSFDKSTDSFKFSKAFIEEILTADIEGVNNIEVYPFDRCFVFKNSALDTKKNSTHIVISEAQLLQKSISSEEQIQKRGNFLYEWERFHKDIKDYDLDFSKKSIEFAQYKVQETLGNQQELVLDGYKELINYKEDEGLKDFKHDDEKAIDFMLYNLLTQKAEPKDILDLEKKYFGNADGLCYIYANGVDLKNMPLLKSFQEAYWRNTFALNKENILEDFNFEKFIKEVDVSNTKIVFISYDPARAKSEKNIEIDSKHSFSILIVANWDIPKTISEISAEREDLNTALKLIVRQKTESAALIQQEREKQKRFISNQLRQAIHAIKGSVQDQNIKDEIEKVYDRFKKKLEDDQQELKEISIENESEKLRVKTLFENLIDDSFNLKELKTLWDKVAQEMLKMDYNPKVLSVKDESLKFKLQESFLPDFTIKLDSITVQEAFHVMVKNAVESTLSTNTKSLTVSLNVSYINEINGLLNICLINDTQPIEKTLLDAMNTSYDDIAKNEDKEGSTGAGVASSRSQLESRFGEDASIQFKLLSKTKIKSILTLPIEIIKKQNYYKATTNKVIEDNVQDILYLEDEEKYFSSSINFLSKHNLECTHSKSIESFNDIWQKSNILFTDINILNMGKEGRYGINATINFKKKNTEGTVFILTNESKAEILKNLLERKTDESIIHYKDITSIQTGHIYILSEKTIEMACSSHKGILPFLTNKIEEECAKLDYTKIDTLNFPENFYDFKDLYLYKTIEKTLLENVYQKWSNKEYLHPVENLEDSVANPDVFSNLLIVPIIIDDSIELNYSRIALFSLKNNMLILPIKEENEIDISQLSLLLQKKEISLRETGIFSALNHDLSNIPNKDVEQLTKDIMNLDIYHDAKNLNTKNIFEPARNEIAEIQNLYTKINRVMEQNKELENDMSKLVASLKYLIDVTKLLEEVSK